jgi:hypothetical protein
MKPLRASLCALMVACLVAACAAPDRPRAPVRAAVVEKLDIGTRKIAFGGLNFGAVGPYEYIAGVATVRLDPTNPANRGIVDVEKAADADGFVRYQTDVVLLRPAQAAKASRALIFDIANRGNKLALVRLNDGATHFNTAEQSGQGWAMRQGHTLLWVGWQGDVPLGKAGDVVGTRFPTATDKGKPITGTSLEEFIFDDTAAVSNAPLTYAAASTDQAQATLTVRAKPDAPATTLPATAWRYVNPREIAITRAAGFDGGAIYQFTYEARDPMVMGLGLSAVRDVVAYFKSGANDASGAPNPLADIRPEVTVAFGISQSGRFLRDFVWMGFNAAPDGGRVFDGALPLIAGSRKSYTNARWAQPGRFSRQHEDHFYPGDQFPFTYGVITDPVSGRTDGIFARCREDSTCPKTMHVDSNLEFWQARASLVVTDGAGGAVALPEDVRAYLMASTQHGPATRPAAGICQQLNNPAQQASTVRALMARLIDWTKTGKAPPATRYPMLADGTLVAADRLAMGFPDLAGLGVDFPTVMNELTVVDHGRVPPLPDGTKRYQLLVPRTDAHGHDVAGIRMPEIEVPLATHSGWGLRKSGFAEGNLCGLNGVYVPLARDASLRNAKRDPRPSVAERYPTRALYVQRVRAAAEKLAADGYLLDEDIARWAERAAKEPQVQFLQP